MGAGVYALVLVGGIAIGVLGMALYYQSGADFRTDSVVTNGVTMCNYFGCDTYVGIPAGWVESPFMRDGEDASDFQKWSHCMQWARGAEFESNEVRMCTPLDWNHVRGTIWLDPIQAPDQNQ